MPWGLPPLVGGQVHRVAQPHEVRPPGRAAVLGVDVGEPDGAGGSAVRLPEPARRVEHHLAVVERDEVRGVGLAGGVHVQNQRAAVFLYCGWYRSASTPPGILNRVTRPYPWSLIAQVNSTPRAFSSATVLCTSSQ